MIYQQSALWVFKGPQVAATRFWLDANSRNNLAACIVFAHPITNRTETSCGPYHTSPLAASQGLRAHLPPYPPLHTTDHMLRYRPPVLQSGRRLSRFLLLCPAAVIHPRRARRLHQQTYFHHHRPCLQGDTKNHRSEHTL